MIDIAKLAEIIDDATRTATLVPKLSSKGSLTLAEAYEIQAASVARRLERGDAMIGVKMGMTNPVLRTQLGLDDAVWGRLTREMRVADGGELTLIPQLSPRVEAELVFLLKKPLSGPVSPAEAMNAVEAVAPAIEIIGTRYDDLAFSLVDAIADNVSSFGLCVGGWNKPDIDISNLGMVLEFNGRVVQLGSSAALAGHPARSLAAASRLAGEAGIEIQAGWIVLAGSATTPTAIEAGMHIRHVVEKLGAVEFDAA
ncbi:MAG TPA: fumarylacetoacetate hydrolase family protein [Alphaproteobacteria bacterium]|nr:fumarylacetoacetate hydrolase family protein [Alphaproteobacteria bacterium]